MMASSTTQDASSSRDDLEVSDHSSEEETEQVEHYFRSLAVDLSPQLQPQPQHQPQQQQQSSDNSSDILPIPVPFTITFSLPTPPSQQLGAAQAQARGRSLRSRRLRSQTSLTPSGQRIREAVRSRPRCGLHLLRSLRNDRVLGVPQARNDPEKPPRHPGRTDKLFVPKDGDLLLHHVKKPGKRVVEFFDAEQAARFEEGDYLLRFKVDNHAFVHHSSVTALGYLYHHGNWAYLGKDSDYMELA